MGNNHNVKFSANNMSSAKFVCNFGYLFKARPDFEFNKSIFSTQNNKMTLALASLGLSLCLALLIVTVGFALPQRSTPKAKPLRFSIGECDIPDPWELGQTYIDVTIDPFLVINGGSIQDGSVTTGLSGLVVEVNYNAVLQQVTFKLTLPSFYTIGERYLATGFLDALPFRPNTFPSGTFQGEGAYEGYIEDLHIEGKLNVIVNLITNRLNVRNVMISTLNFTSAYVELGGYAVDSGSECGYVPVDWESWNSVFKPNFDLDWANSTIKNEILIKVTKVWDAYLSQFTLAEIIEWWQNPCPDPPVPCKRNL